MAVSRYFNVTNPPKLIEDLEEDPFINHEETQTNNQDPKQMENQNLNQKKKKKKKKKKRKEPKKSSSWKRGC